MKKALLFSILSVFCLSVTSCAMVNKKEEKKRKPSHPHHRRYHSELIVE